ncbi:hypothetical protein MHYP_G00100370 [Metynnis hypsauchen]
MSLFVSLLVLIFISGVVAQDGWAVNYNTKSVCALKGSALTMECTYTTPSGHSVQKAFWTKELVASGSEPPDLLDDPEYRGRVQYLGDEHSDCTLRFKTVREKDQSKYYFTFITEQPGGKYQGEGGVYLSVTDLQVEVPERVIEGDNVTLTCKTSFSLSDRTTFTWYRNGHRLSSSTDQHHLQPVSREDAGRYHCAILGQNLHSPEVTLNVRYGPKNISVSISPSGEIVEGSSVTLTCSSDANPPVEYNWIKGTSLVAEGETYTMKKISSVDSGEYKCRSSNGYIKKLSEALTLNVLHGPKKVLVSVTFSDEKLEGSSVNLTCSSDDPPVQNYTWFKEGGSSPVGSGHSYSFIFDSKSSGWYYCVAQNKYGSKKSAAVPVIIKEHSMILYVVVGVGLCGVAAFIAVVFLLGNKKKRTVEEDDHQNVDPNSKEDTYTALDPVSRSSDDVYNTLAADLLTSLRMSLTVSLLVLIFISDLQVEVPERVIEGDKVTLTCKTSFSLSDRPTFTWYKNGNRLSSSTDQLHLQPVSIEDAGWYHCAVLGLRSPVVTLHVRYLRVEVPERVIEGDKVTLTCKTSFSLSDSPTFTWYKNGRYLSSGTKIHLQPVSREDAGRYHCAVLGLNLLSPEVTLNVRYGPKSISVSISPPGVIVEGSSVTLTCSSDGNPPVEYNWIKGKSSVAEGESYTMKEISSADSGEYKCRSSNEHGYKYSEALTLNVLYLRVEVPERVIEGDKVTLTCKTSFSLSDRPTFTWYKNGRPLSSSTDQLHLQSVSRENKDRYLCAVLGLNLLSPEVTLNVRYGPKSISVSISPSGVIVEGSSVTLTCSSDGNPPVEYNWIKGTSLVAKGETYTMKKISSVDSGDYKCRSSNEHGEKLSEALTLNVLYPPKSVSVSISPSGEIAVGSSVNLTCSSDANPPVQNYTWFKEGEREEAIQLMMQTKHRQNVDPNAKDDTYTALDPVSRSSDDVYNTLANVDPNAKDDTYTALDPMSRSSDDVYNTLATVHSSPSDDLYSALDPQSRSPEYDTLATVRNQH